MIKDKDTRWVRLPTETLSLLAEYQQEAPEGVPYILLTKERYDVVLKRWYECRMQGKEWQNRYMVNNVLRNFKVHARRAGIRFNGEFTIHTFRKSCAQNWADRLPANVVKFYLGHSSVTTTNQFYSVVDESHAAWTRDAMDAMLRSSTASALDTGQTLTPKNDEEVDTKKTELTSDSSANSSKTSTSTTSQDWAMQDSDLRPPACKAGALAD